MAEHISFPSINQFKDVIKHIHSGCHYHQIPVPTVTFRGTVKLHGTNAGICRPVNGGVNDIYYQSRERVITPEQDNAGFAMWAYGNREVFNDLFDAIAATHSDKDDIIQIFGEWAGGNIQKGVGLNQLEKSFFVFGVRVSKDSSSNDWFFHRNTTRYIDTIIDARIPNMYDINKFPHWEIDIDMTDAKAVQNKLIELTMAVEEDCPVVRTLRGDQTVTPNIGEGIVWEAMRPRGLDVDPRLVNILSGLRFKVKGEKHSASKVKTIAPVDTEKLNSIKEFVEYAVTENRLNQGLDKLREKGLPQDSTSTGEFIKWIMGDVLKEELDVVAKSGLTTKEITGPIANKARDFFMKQL